MKKLLLLSLLSFTLFQCNILEEDPLPESGEAIDIDAANVLMALNTGEGLIKVGGLLAPGTTTEDVEVIKQPEFGSISVLNEQYLKYKPREGKENYEEEIILAHRQDPQDKSSLLVVVRSDPSLFCIVDKFEPVYLGMPLNFSIKKGETLDEELLSLFCEYERGGNAGVATFSHPELESDGMEIHISTQSARLKFTPPAGFTGKKGMIYELCYDLQDQSCLGQQQFHECPSYPQSCKYFLYAYVEIDVTE